jgi:hypothetical protein
MDERMQKVVGFRKKAADLRASVATFSLERQGDILEIARRYELLADQIERTGTWNKHAED